MSRRLGVVTTQQLDKPGSSGCRGPAMGQQGELGEVPRVWVLVLTEVGVWSEVRGFEPSKPPHPHPPPHGHLTGPDRGQISFQNPELGSCCWPLPQGWAGHQDMRTARKDSQSSEGQDQESTGPWFLAVCGPNPTKPTISPACKIRHYTPTLPQGLRLYCQACTISSCLLKFPVLLNIFAGGCECVCVYVRTCSQNSDL